MSSADRFCVNTKWRWVGVSKGMAVSVLGFRMALVATLWVVSLLPCTIGLRKQFSALYPSSEVFCSLDEWLLAKSADY